MQQPVRLPARRAQAGVAPRRAAGPRLVAHRAAARHLVRVLRARLGHVVVQHDAVMHGARRERAFHRLAGAVDRKAAVLRAGCLASRAVCREH